MSAVTRGARAGRRVDASTSTRRPARTSRSCEQQVHGKPLVYLDNAATTQKPQAVIDALDRLLPRTTTPTSTAASHLLSERATAAYEGARAKIARVPQRARDAREIVFTRGTHRGDQPRRAELRRGRA